MAVTEDISGYSTTQASNTPAGTDNVGPDLDDHLRNIKQNIRKAATHNVEDTAGAFDSLGTRGVFWLDPSASPTLTLRYIPGTGGTIAVAEINESASSVTPYVGSVKMGTLGVSLAGQESTASAFTALGFSAVGKELATATSTAGAFNALGITQAVQDFVTATDTAAMVNALGISTYGATLVAEESTSSAVTTLGLDNITTATLASALSGSATSVFNFAGIASGANEIIVSFHNFASDGTDNTIVQLGDSGGVEVTDYESGSEAGGGNVSSSAGFVVRTPSSVGLYGHMILTRHSGNTWVASHATKFASASPAGGGSKTLSGELTQVQITFTGTDDATGGTVAVLSKT